MGGGTSPELVAAVSNAGGLGTLGLSGRAPHEVREVIARTQELTTRPFGVNFLLFRVGPDDPSIAAALEARPSVVAYAWPWADQDLGPFVARARAAGAKVMVMVSVLSDARRAVRAGADVVIAQGTEGGGHVGLMGTMPFVPMVVSAVAPTPVLAAGGIVDGRGLVAALALGAEGVLLGTRFLATDEAPILPSYKAAILASDGQDTVITEIPDLASGSTWPGAFSRAWRNAFIERWSGRESELRRRRGEVAREVAAARAAGNATEVPLLFGQDAGLIDSLLPASEVVRRIVEEGSEMIQGRLGAMVDRSSLP